MREPLQAPPRSEAGQLGPEPDRSRFLDPWNDVTLLWYYEDLGKWHGFVRFLGLPHLREDPDQPLEELFVEPALSRQALTVDMPPSGWPAGVEPALAVIAALPRLVLLGDPGSGKSTLVSWIAWTLSKPRPNRWRERLGPLVPLPFVLRELELPTGLTWESLLDAFLRHGVAARLGTRQRLVDLLERGQAWLLFDGVDEIGSLSTRLELRSAVWELGRRFPGCRILVTSRIVGYDEVPFHRFHFLPPGVEVGAGAQAGWVKEPIVQYPPVVADEQAVPSAMGPLTSLLVREIAERAELGELRYVAPLDDAQIELFAQKWYARREAAEQLRAAGAADLIAAVRGSESTLRLARNPNLLTLMALVHRVQRRLPHGRALLFEKISEAYLESIDAFRGIQEVNYSLAEKKRWLARVGFEMQCRRSGAATQGEEPKREVLATREEVRDWILSAMAVSSRDADPPAADRYLDYIGRRSGLLLPRGEGLFAFTHLSFQEYFAAVHLMSQVTSPRWARGEAPPGARQEDLRAYANQGSWREVLVLLCELLAERPEWLEDLLPALFGEGFEALEQRKSALQQAVRAALLAELAADPYSGLAKSTRGLACEACWRWVWRASEDWGESLLELIFPWQLEGILRWLMDLESDDAAEIWRRFEKVAAEAPRTALVLGGGPMSDASPLSKLVALKSLSLRGTRVEDVGPLSKLARLERLDLKGTQVSDIAPLRHLHALLSLNLSDTKVADIGALGALKELTELNLTRTSVRDLGCLRGHHNLQRLTLDGTRLTDFSPLRTLRDLSFLNLSRTDLGDLNDLSGLRKLSMLFLSRTRVSDLSPIRRLHSLQLLALQGTSVSDLGPLQQLHNLTSLDLGATNVWDLLPLRELENLIQLNLSSTRVEDISPLYRLPRLRRLALRGAPVTVEHLSGLDPRVQVVR
jgi:internalin A